jgi:hypothetical protein
VNQRHEEQYCSMLLKCLAWINGKVLEQYEVVKPVILIRTGCDPLPWPDTAYDRIHSQQRRVVTSQQQVLDPLAASTGGSRV